MILAQQGLALVFLLSGSGFAESDSTFAGCAVDHLRRPLTNAEARVLSSVASGEVAGCPRDSELPTIGGDLVAWLLTDPDAAKHVPMATGVAIVGHFIEGDVKLNHATVAFPVEFDRCAFSSPLSAESTTFESSVWIENSCLPGLNASGLRARQNVRLSVICDEAIRLGSVSSKLDLDLSGLECTSLHLDQANVGGALLVESARIWDYWERPRPLEYRYRSRQQRRSSGSSCQRAQCRPAPDCERRLLPRRSDDF